GFDRQRFIDDLILPAYQQSVARILVRHELPVALYGAGWDQVEDLRKFHRGRVETAEQFDAAVEAAGVLVHCWPGVASHPVEATHPLVVGPARRAESLVRDVRLSLSGKLARPERNGPQLSAELVARFLI